jgi:hypothetical protein
MEITRQLIVQILYLFIEDFGTNGGCCLLKFQDPSDNAIRTTVAIPEELSGNPQSMGSLGEFSKTDSCQISLLFRCPIILK